MVNTVLLISGMLCIIVSGDFNFCMGIIISMLIQ